MRILHILDHSILLHSGYTFRTGINGGQTPFVLWIDVLHVTELRPMLRSM